MATYDEDDNSSPTFESTQNIALSQIIVPRSPVFFSLPLATSLLALFLFRVLGPSRRLRLPSRPLPHLLPVLLLQPFVPALQAQQPQQCVGAADTDHEPRGQVHEQRGEEQAVGGTQDVRGPRGDLLHPDGQVLLHPDQADEGVDEPAGDPVVVKGNALERRDIAFGEDERGTEDDEIGSVWSVTCDGERESAGGEIVEHR